MKYKGREVVQVPDIDETCKGCVATSIGCSGTDLIYECCEGKIFIYKTKEKKLLKKDLEIENKNLIIRIDCLNNKLGNEQSLKQEAFEQCDVRDKLIDKLEEVKKDLEVKLAKAGLRIQSWKKEVDEKNCTIARVEKELDEEANKNTGLQIKLNQLTLDNSSLYNVIIKLGNE